MSLPPSEIPLGAMRFNSDSQKLEYWMGSAWMQIQTFSPNLGNSDAGVRGVMIGGHAHPNYYNTIDFVTIPVQGNATDFGDATITVAQSQGCASSTRGFSAGSWQGASGPVTDTIQFVTISSTGDGTDFGNLTESVRLCGLLSNATRAVRVAGANPSTNTMDYWTMASTGNAVNFGDVTTSSSHWASCVSNPTRGVWVSGLASNDIIEFITIATTGNSVDFGDTTQGNVGEQPHGGGNSIRGIWAGGSTPVSYTH